MTAIRSLLAFVAAGLLPVAAEPTVRGANEVTRFILVSAPRTSKVSYVRVGRFGHLAGEAQDLINSGLLHPQGLAVDQLRSRLYVADPDNKTILAYTLTVKDGGLIAAQPSIISNSVESRWVTVDSVGNLFFSDEALNRIMKVSAGNVKRGNVSTPEVVYDGTTITAVSSPGGVASDNFYVYWTNKQVGNEVGSLIRGSEMPTSTNMASSVSVLAQNTVKSYGVCLAMDNIYYTDSEKKLYGVKKAGGDVVEVSDKLMQPRGCAYDGDSTVYIADRTANKVYSFPGNMQTIQLTSLSTAMEYEDAFGLAVFSQASRVWGVALSSLAAALLATAW